MVSWVCCQGVVAASAQQAGLRLELTVCSPSAATSGAQVVTGGIPFPRGQLAVTDQLRLFDGAGNELPLQQEVLATWDAEGRQTRWLLLDSQIAAGREKTRLVLVRSEGTAAVESRPRPDPEQSPWPPEELIRSLYMVDQHGRRYAADPDDVETVVRTETSGPLRTVVRVHVWHRDEKGRPFCRAILRLHYYAGLDRVRILHSLVMDADPEQVQIRGLGLRLEGPSPALTRILVSGEQSDRQVIECAGPVALLQDRDDRFTITSGAPRPGRRAGRRSGTWLCAVGKHYATAVFMRNGWEEFPKALNWDGRRLDVQLWPTDDCPPLDLSGIAQPILKPDTEEELRAGLAGNPQASVSLYRFVTKGQTDWTLDSVVPLMRRARELEAELLPGRFAYYYLPFGQNGRGSMKTHEVVLARLPADISGSELTGLAERIRFPSVLSASPEWNCRSGAVGPQLPYGAGEFADVDRAMTYDELDDTEQFRERLRLYGARDFGDYLNGNPAMAGALYHVYGPAAKVRVTDRIGWMNNESHDSAVGAWLQFLRTADSRIFYRAEAACEHLVSVDQQHSFPALRQHRAISFYHTLNHHDGGPASSHTLSGGYLLGYYITGDRGLRETVLANADYFVDQQRQAGTGWYAGTSPTRANIAPLTCVMNAFTLTWDRRYLTSIDRFLAVWAPVYDVQRHYLGGTLPYPGAEFARLVDHPVFDAAYRRIMNNLRTKQAIDGQSPYYLPGMVHMWHQTGDPSYVAYCRLVFQWYRHNLHTRGSADSVRRTVYGLPEFKYGMVSGYLAAGLAAIEAARQRGIDLAAATEKLRTDRSGQLFYSVSGIVEGQPGRWYPPAVTQP